MKRWCVLINWLMVALIFLVLPQIHVRADAAAPYATFNFNFQGSPIAIVRGDLVLCNDATCAESQSGTYRRAPYHVCGALSCSFTVPDSAPYRKLIINFADRTRESNVFQQARAYAIYTVNVTDTTLTVEEDLAAEDRLDADVALKNITGFFPIPLVLTVAVDTIIGWLYVLIFRLPRLLLKWISLIPFITLPIVWFGFLRLPLPIHLTLLVAEGFVVVFEAAFLYWRGQKQLTIWHAVILSLLVNAASYGFGLLLLG